MSRGRLIIISAPAGTGKTTLTHMLLKAHEGEIVQSISCTTRPIRDGELDGRDYHFLTKEEFQRRKSAGDFLESAEVFGNDYGTLKGDVCALLDAGKHVVLVIDVQGASQLRGEEGALSLFITPPSLEILEKRLIGRHSESDESLKRRLSRAKEELDQAKHYDYTIVNDELDHAFAELDKIIQKEIYDKR